MIEIERGRRDAAGAAMTRARKDLENVDWIIECRRDDLAQLRLMVELPKPPVVREIAKRQPPDLRGGSRRHRFPGRESGVKIRGPLHPRRGLAKVARSFAAPRSWRVVGLFLQAQRLVDCSSIHTMVFTQ
jgi:hypothetical protein